MKPPNDNGKTLGLLREVPAEVSLEQVGRMVIAFPLAGATAAWLAWSKFHLNSILMTTTGSLIIGGGIYLASIGDPAPREVAGNAPAPSPVEVLMEEAPGPDEPAVVLTMPGTEPGAQGTPPSVEARPIVAEEPPAPESTPAPPEEVLVASLSMPEGSPPAVVWRMPRNTRTYGLKGFTGVVLEASIDVAVEEGAFSVTATGEQDPLERLKVTMEDNMLRIGMDEPRRGMEQYSCGSSVSMVVRMPQVKRLAVLGSGSMTVRTFGRADDLRLVLQGSGDLLVEAIKEMRSLSIELDGSGDILLGEANVSGATSIRLSGSGDVRIAGRTAEMDISIVGSGDVAASEMEARSAKVRVVGSGDAYVNSEGALDRRVTGSGAIHLSGSSGSNRPRGVGARSY